MISAEEGPPYLSALNPMNYSVWSILESKTCTKPHKTLVSLKQSLLREGGMLKDHLKVPSKLNIWVPHALTEKHLCRRVNVCDLLLKRQGNDPFLKRIITGEEKWVVYNNVKCKRSWSKKINRLKAFQKSILIKERSCYLLGGISKESVFFRFYRTIQPSLSSDGHKLNDSPKKNRPELIRRKGVVFHQDNARPNVSLVTHQKIFQLEWDTLPHPSYSSDLAPSDYYLFRSLQKF
ncbi:histone-lysine N-methyltransferase SETMAR [Trichonephila clavipes]|nr:histone-lysine N-methyltransferase SETMAR [Trichonephila clavipes]